ncbi:helix-turn-helix transcriptional regulator [Telmatobacter bradus]|uniref:helix-turn-helix transcriptional regulator n=1 Tax=Telmatobacter bradus TaxID=474953 RepID=UPI003B430761
MNKKDTSSTELPTTLTPKEVAQLLLISEESLANRRSQGRGPIYRKLGNRVLYFECDVIAYLNSLPTIHPAV